MGLVSIFRKNNMKKAPLPTISLLVQIGEEIQAPVFYDDSVQILLKLAWIVSLTIQDLYGVNRV